MLSKSLDLKVLICQTNPEFKEPKKNIEKVRTSLEKYSSKDEIDVILFPEMAFTGYSFQSVEDALPFCEEAGRGPVFEFMKELAKKTKAYIMCGYPEKQVAVFSRESLYNSLMVIDRKGNLLHNYRKHFLYETDKKWCKEGGQFETVELENTKGQKYKAGLGICMDINPFEFRDPSKYEFGIFMLTQKVDAVFMACSWIDHEPQDDSGKSIYGFINYWVERLEPLFFSQKNWAFFLSNRVGIEGKTTFAGSSCALKREKERDLKVISALNKRKEGYLLAEVCINNS
jgi:protein N-terminal amidase